MSAFVSFDVVVKALRGKRVVLVGSAPCVLDNEPGFIDAHDVVVRVNNYKLGQAQGQRTDVFYSFFGSSIRKSAEELIRDGVKLCICKCPNSKPIECAWHERNGKQLGVDFQYIYRTRAQWWFCDTYVPSDERFIETFNLLESHVPTTGFAAILDMLKCEPGSLHLTGFDFFSSGLHNVDEKWRAGDPTDPIGHRPDLELGWLCDNEEYYPISFDAKLKQLMSERAEMKT